MHPAWLFSLVLLIPVFVHLFSFRRTKKILFPTLRFIVKVFTQSKSRTRLKHYLILLNRLLIFGGLLYLLIAYWVSRSEAVKVIGNNVLLDNSLSMSIRKDGISAKEEAYVYLENHFDLNFDPSAHMSVVESAHTTLTFLNYSNNLVSKALDYEWVISDFQGVSVEDIDRLVKDTSLVRNLRLVGNINEYKNLFVDSLVLSLNAEDLSQQSITVFFNVSGVFDERNVVIKLLHADRQLSSVVRDIREIREVQFDIPLTSDGLFSIEIDGDEVLYDNSFRFVIEKKKKSVISLIDNADNPYLKEVFANPELFDLSIIDPKSIDFSSLQDADVVVINELNSLPSGLESQLQDKTVIIFPSLNFDGGGVSVLGITTGRKTDHDWFEIGIDYDYPIFSGVFEKANSNALLPRAVALYTISGNYETVISLRNGEPFLIKSLFKDYYFINTVLKKEYSNIASHALFLPLFYQIALASVDYDKRSYYYPDDLMFIDVHNSEIPPVIVAEDLEIIPEFRPSEAGMTLIIPTHLKAGYYAILHNGDSLAWLAVNLPKGESKMEGLTIGDLRHHFGNMDHVSIQSLANDTESLFSEGEGTRLWKYVLILVVLLLLTETMLHRYLR